MKKRIRIAVSWVLVSLTLQVVFYYYFNMQVAKVMDPSSSAPVVVQSLEAVVPGTKHENLQISYAKDYLAYMENDVLKVFNLKQNKVVFEKKPPVDGETKHGVIFFQWLPDRDTLVYFYAKKNPNPYTNVVVPVTPSLQPSQGNAGQNTNISAALKSSAQAASSSVSTPKNQTKVKTQAASVTQTNNAVASPPSQVSPPNSAGAVTPVTTPRTAVPQNPTNPQNSTLTEDPNQAPNPVPNPAPKPQPETRIEKRYNNPQLTELFSLELPPGDEDELAPDDRFNRSIDSFPAGGEITQMVVSTFTNLMYLTIKTGANTQLLEIDIMKNVRTLSKSGEQIAQISTSDKFGTLFIKSRVAKVDQILALQGSAREAISKDSEDVILGNRAGTIYLGKVTAGQLVNIRSSPDTDSKKMKFSTVWEGSIPFKNHKGVIVSVSKDIIIYDNKTAYIVQNGKDKKIDLPGEENLISIDGVELVQIGRNSGSTKIKLQPMPK